MRAASMAWEVAYRQGHRQHRRCLSSRARVESLPHERLARSGVRGLLRAPHVCKDFWRHLDHYGFLPCERERKAFVEACARPPRAALRVNTLKRPGASWKQHLQSELGWQLKAVPWCRSGYFVDAGQDTLSQAPGHPSGEFFLQEATSMLPPEVLWSLVRHDPKRQLLLLDLCAAPGGKAAHLASLLKDKGLLVVNDVCEKRAGALRANMVAAGAPNSVLFAGDGTAAGRRWPGTFDGVLVDAPCSGQGTVRKNRSVLRAWNADFLQRAARQQLRLLRSAWRALKPGGVLVYCTCSLTWDENEAVLEEFLSDHSEGQALVEDLSNFPGVGRAVDCRGFVRIWPQLFDTDGFFVAALRKIAAGLEGGRADLQASKRFSFALPGQPRQLRQEAESHLQEQLQCVLGPRVSFRSASAGSELMEIQDNNGRPGGVWMIPQAFLESAAEGAPVAEGAVLRSESEAESSAASSAPEPFQLVSPGIFLGRTHEKMITSLRPQLKPSAEFHVWAGGREGQQCRSTAGWLQLRLQAHLEEDAAAFNALLDACANDVSLGLAAAELWMKRMQVASIAPESVTFGALLKAAARAEATAAAERWFEAMKFNGIQGDLVKYSTVCDSYARAGDTKGAEVWFRKLLTSRLQPNVVTYASLLKACERAAEPLRAELWLMRQVQVHGVRANVPCYCALIRAYGEVDDAQAAAQVLHRMRQSGVKPGAKTLAEVAHISASGTS